MRISRVGLEALALFEFEGAIGQSRSNASKLDSALGEGDRAILPLEELEDRADSPCAYSSSRSGLAPAGIAFIASINLDHFPFFDEERDLNRQIGF